MRNALRVAQAGLWALALWRVVGRGGQPWNGKALAVIVAISALYGLIHWQNDRISAWLSEKRWFESLADILVPLAGLAVIGTLIWQAAKLATRFAGWGWGIAAAIAVLIAFFYFMGGVFDGQAKRREAEEAREAGDFEKAERLLKEGIAEAGKVKAGSAANEATLRWDLANLYQSLERWQEAEQEVRAAVVAAGDSHSPFAVQIRQCAPSVLFQLLAQQEKWKELDDDTKIALRGRSGEQAIGILQERAAALLHLNRPETAIELLTRALGLAQAGKNKDTTARSYRMLSLAQLGSGRTEDGMRTLMDLDAFASTLPEKERLHWQIASRDLLAQAALKIGDPARALQMVEEAMARVDQLKDNNPEARGERLFLMSKALLGLGRREEAKARAVEAVGLWDVAGIELNDDVRELLARVETVEA